MDADRPNTVQATKSGWVLNGNRSEFRLINTTDNSEITFNAPRILSKYSNRSFYSFPAIALVNNRPASIMIAIQWFSPPHLFLWKRKTKVYSTDLRTFQPGANTANWLDVASIPARQEGGLRMYYDDAQTQFTLQFTDDKTGAEAHIDFQVDTNMAVTPSSSICDSTSSETRLGRRFSDGSSGGSVSGGGGSSSGGGGSGNNAWGGSRYRPIAEYGDNDE